MTALVTECVEQIAPLSPAPLGVDVTRLKRIDRRHVELPAAGASDLQRRIDLEAGECECHRAERRFEDANGLHEIGVRGTHREELVKCRHSQELEDRRRSLYAVTFFRHDRGFWGRGWMDGYKMRYILWLRHWS